MSDVFSVPQPADSGEAQVDGCPVMVMQDLSMDWEELLRYIYDGAATRKGEPPSFRLVAAMLRLGHKYEFESFKQQGLDQFSRLFPASPTQFVEATEHQARWLASSTDSSICDAINLALDLKLQRTLPALLFVATTERYYPKIVKDGSVSQSNKITKLPNEVALTLMSARERAYEGVMNHIYLHLLGIGTDTLPARSCLQRRTCPATVSSLRHFVIKPPFKMSCSFAYDLKKVCSDGFCSDCIRVGFSKVEEGRQKVWEELPAYFDLPPWDNLKNFDFSYFTH
ncbi:hypothetical protein CC2G_013295 [Coprinopsis cinerea AmutBmut pab1-1]|nr:hypothetical protein CC2G_013295 [Coprinopsis cinerea AmutBmut pab1-1]